MDESFTKQRALELWSEGVHQQIEGHFAEAIRLYTKSIETHPTAEAYTFRGWAYSFLGRIDDAIAECKKAIEVDATFGNPYNDIGAYLLGKGEFDEAIPWLERAKTAPRYEPRHFPYMNLARVYAAKGMILKAISELEQALRIEPNDAVSNEMLRELRSALN